MSKSKFVIDRLAKLFEQGLISYKDLSNEIINILQKIRKNAKLSKPKHIWNSDEAMNKETLLKTINEY